MDAPDNACVWRASSPNTLFVDDSPASLSLSMSLSMSSIDGLDCSFPRDFLISFTSVTRFFGSIAAADAAAAAAAAAAEFARDFRNNSVFTKLYNNGVNRRTSKSPDSSIFT